VAAQDAMSVSATCIPAQAVGVPGSLGSRATGSHPPSAAKSKTAGTSRSRGTSKERRLARRAAEQAAKAASAAQPVTSGNRHGRFHLSCAGTASFSWLKMTVDKLSVRIDSGVEDQLSLVTPSQLPQLMHAEVYVSGKPPTVAQFKTFLQVQNDRLHTERWAEVPPYHR